jgi:arylsulfatase A-like enzyme
MKNRANAIRRGAWATAATVALVAAGAASTQPPPTARPPNLIVILADDLGWGDVCAYGCERGRTPNLDALAASGARFTSGYVTAPVCSPSRAALMSGRYQQRFGHEFNTGGPQRDRIALGMPLGERLLPQYLAERGYRSGMIGKWHLGALPQFHPMERGFDEFFGFLHAANPYFPEPGTPGSHFADRGQRRGGGEPRREADNAILRGRDAVVEPAYLTEAFTREAVSFIERHRDQPFFLYVAYNAPHTPLQVSEKHWNRFPEIADEAQRIYAAMTSALDDGVGEIVAALERTGLRDSTLVVFASDNGCATYTAACSNGPLLGGKVTFFEGGVRVPFLASWPGTIAPARTLDAPVSTLDLLPTALDLAGARSPAGEHRLDGVSLLPLLRGEATTLDRRDLFWRNSQSWAARHDNWKLIQYEGLTPFLFDLASDPGESRNLAAAQPERVADLTRRFREWEKGTIEPLWPMRVTYYVVLEEILSRRPMRLLTAAEPGTIEVEF